MSPIEVLIDLLGSGPEDLHGAHSGAPGNRRNIGSRNKRLLHKPGLRLDGPAAPSPKRPCLQMLESDGRPSKF
jgi:hypothetical protein